MWTGNHPKNEPEQLYEKRSCYRSVFLLHYKYLNINYLYPIVLEI